MRMRNMKLLTREHGVSLKVRDNAPTSQPGNEIVAALKVRKPESGDWLEIELESGGVSLH